MKTDITKYEDKKIKNIYNMKVEEKGLPTKLGLNKKIVESISMEKNEPKWVLDIRLKALDIRNFI